MGHGMAAWQHGKAISSLHTMALLQAYEYVRSCHFGVTTA